MANKRFGDDFQEFTSPPQWDDMLLIQSSADKKTYKTKREELLRNVDIEYTVFEFAKNASKIVAPTIGWTEAPPITADNEWLWMKQGKIRPLTSATTTWSGPVRIKGEQGGIGSRGAQGLQGLQGLSAYAIAVQSGYTGTEAQFGADQATIAANSARLSEVETNKADLGNNGYVYPAQISPLQGKQTGVELAGASRYTKVLPDEITQQLVANSFSIECYFDWDGSKSDTTYTYNMFGMLDNNNIPLFSIYRAPDGYIFARITNVGADGTSELVTLPGKMVAGATHMVVTVDRINNTLTGYVNGVLLGAKTFSVSTSRISSGTFEIGTPRAVAKPFTAHHIRIFNYILSQGEVNMLYNSGNPETLMLSNRQKPPMWIAPDPNVFYSISNDSKSYPAIESKLEDIDGFSGQFRKVVRTAAGTRPVNVLSVYFNPLISTSIPDFKVGTQIQIVFMYRSNIDFVVSNAFELKHNLDAPRKIVAYSKSDRIVGFINQSGEIMDDSPTAWIEYQILSVRSMTCIAEYLPWGLLSDGWRDTSGNSNDLTATGSVTLSYEKKYSGSPLTPLFVARGAVYKASTGFYELNGLTDITEEEMINIYNITASWQMVPYGFKNVGGENAPINIRTNFETTSQIYGTSAAGFIGYCQSLEIYKASGNTNPSNYTEAFYRCTKLHTIMNPITFSLVTQANNMFGLCSALKSVNIKGVTISLSFKDSPLLSRDSIIYLITNAANTGPITLTLHAEAKARLTAEDIALASSKNITIA